MYITINISKYIKKNEVQQNPHYQIQLKYSMSCVFIRKWNLDTVLQREGHVKTEEDSLLQDKERDLRETGTLKPKYHTSGLQNS